MQPRTLLFCRPDQEIAFRVISRSAANLYLAGFLLERGDLTPYAGHIFPITPELHAQIKLLLKEAKFAFQNDLRDVNYRVLEPKADRPFGAEQMMKLLMEQLLIYLVRGVQAAHGRPYPELLRESLVLINQGKDTYFDRLVHYLEENIGRALTLEDIARENFTSRSKIQRVFHKCAAEGVISFHQKLKIERAKFLLRETSMSVTQVSEALGFSSVHYFSKKFKQLLRMTPSEYARFVK